MYSPAGKNLFMGQSKSTAFPDVMFFFNFMDNNNINITIDYIMILQYLHPYILKL